MPGARMKFALSLMLFLSGCCCSLPSSDTDEWNAAVKREKSNPQSYALEAGTANVFELEVAYPEGWTQQDEDDAAERAAQREERRLQEILQKQGVDVGPLRELPPEPPSRPLRAAYRVRFTTLFPHIAMLEGSLSDRNCRVCVQESSSSKGLFAVSFGSTPVDLQTVTRTQLQAGVKVSGRGSYMSFGEDSSSSVDVPPEGQAQVRLVESCPAKVVRVQKNVTVGNGSGVIAVPQREERTWYEIHDAVCVRSGGSTRVELGPTFKRTTNAPSAHNVMLLRAKLNQR